jgi:hypothetical protein
LSIVISRAYRNLAIWVLNLIVLLIAVNVMLHLFRDPNSATSADLYGMDRVMKGYPGWSRKDVTELLDDFAAANRTGHYDVIKQFGTSQFTSRFVNIDAAGFRAIGNQAQWPPDPKAFNIFVFGGSTTFGVGLPDGETIPSELQKALQVNNFHKAVHVYNFGYPAYSSTQELLSYVDLARRGYVPDLAVFIDGLNDSIDWKGIWGPGRLISARMAFPAAAALADLPMTKWANRIIRLVVTTPRNGIGNRPPESIADQVIGRWMSNRRVIQQIATANGKKTLFVWQPVLYV